MSTPSDEVVPPSFEQSLEALEAIVHDLEDGQVGLAESLAKYEHGVKLLKQCYELLEKAERRIELLTRLDAAGSAVTEPFDDSPTAAQSAGDNVTSAARSRRRSTKTVPKEPPDTQVKSGGDDTIAMDVPGGLF
jgi:exodeoxyribonuclease VII small subunit